MVKEKTETKQLICMNCSTRKLQVIAITYNKEESLLSLLCLTCGQVLYLTLGGLTIPEPKLEPIEKKDQSYFG